MDRLGALAAERATAPLPLGQLSPRVSMCGEMSDQLSDWPRLFPEDSLGWRRVTLSAGQRASISARSSLPEHACTTERQRNQQRQHPYGGPPHP